MSNYQTFTGKKIFPIKSQTACLLKWNWSTINFEKGVTSSCHRVVADPVTVENFKNFHNTPEKIKARELMIQGQWPGRGCQYCEQVESVGGVSDRLMTLERCHGLDKIPPELLIDPNATTITPTILEIYFNNTCNLSCIYCSPHLSSKWNDEIQKFGGIAINNFRQDLHVSDNIRYNQMTAALWEYLIEDDRYKIIRHYQILGGESFLQHELDLSLDFWSQHPNPSLTINLITNLMLPHHLFIKKIEKIESLVNKEAIYMLELTASADCWGPEQEYIRYGLNLDVWKKNFEYMLSKDWCKLSIHSCITSLSVKTMHHLIDNINHWNTRRPPKMPIEHNFDLVLGVERRSIGLHPIVFGNFFKDDFAKILQSMPEETELQITNKKQLRCQIELISKSSKTPQSINWLKEYLTELDRRRDTNWREVFPWLDKDWSE